MVPRQRGSNWKPKWCCCFGSCTTHSLVCWRFQKMYAVCDLVLGIILMKTTNFVLKDFPAEPVLPSKLFTQPDQVRTYLGYTSPNTYSLHFLFSKCKYDNFQIVKCKYNFPDKNLNFKTRIYFAIFMPWSCCC